MSLPKEIMISKAILNNKLKVIIERLVPYMCNENICYDMGGYRLPDNPDIVYCEEYCNSDCPNEKCIRAWMDMVWDEYQWAKENENG